MIIGTCGFGSTGSSAVSDYLLEYGNVQVLDKIEFTWVTGVDSLIDLDYHLNSPHCRTADSIYALARYENHAKRKAIIYKKNAGLDVEEIMGSVHKFLDAITMLKWNWYLNIDNKENVIKRYFNQYLFADRIIPFIEKKKKRQINCFPMKEISFSVKPKNFEEAAQTHVRELLTILGADFTKPIILDQPFSGDNPQACFKFFDDPYAIVVDRDPRDNYVFAKTKLIGRNHFMAVNTVQDFCVYYRALRDNQPYKEKHPRVLSLKFEDLVYHYEETTKKLRDFLHLPENPNPKSIFDPAISMPNTQVWKRFPEYAEDIKYIEENLKEYLFDYTGLPEPDPNKKMFFGKSPLNKK